jgi:hypothetical protein
MNRGEFANLEILSSGCCRYITDVDVIPISENFVVLRSGGEVICY